MYMRFVLMFILMVMFGYAIALFFTNTSEIEVNLLFAQVPAMNTAILLVITFIIGIVAGLMLALLVFKVFQIRWENSRLQKEIKQLRKEQVELATQAAISAQTVTDTSEVSTSTNEQTNNTLNTESTIDKSE